MARRIVLGFLTTVACTTTPKKVDCMVCPQPDIIDVYGGAVDPRDELALETAIATCAREYGPASPCVFQFTRFEPGSYNVICGPQVKSMCEER